MTDMFEVINIILCETNVYDQEKVHTQIYDCLIHGMNGQDIVSKLISILTEKINGAGFKKKIIETAENTKKNISVSRRDIIHVALFVYKMWMDVRQYQLQQKFIGKQKCATLVLRKNPVCILHRLPRRVLIYLLEYLDD